MSSGENRLPDKPLQRLDEPDNSGEVFGARAPLVLVAAPKQDRVRQERRFYEQRAGAFRTMKLMSANRDQVGIELVNRPKRFLAEGLNGIRMEFYTLYAA